MVRGVALGPIGDSPHRETGAGTLTRQHEGREITMDKQPADKQRTLVIDRALKQLSDPAMEKSKAARRLEEVLVAARKSGNLSMSELHRATVDLVAEADLPRYLARSTGPADETRNNGLAVLFLLILLSILLALVEEGSDTAGLIEALIQALLDSLAGSGDNGRRG
jgi:hypothetical protein